MYDHAPLNSSFFKVPMHTFYVLFHVKRQEAALCELYRPLQVPRHNWDILLGRAVKVRCWGGLGPQLSSGKVAEQAW